MGYNIKLYKNCILILEILFSGNKTTTFNYPLEGRKYETTEATTFDFKKDILPQKPKEAALLIDAIEMLRLDGSVETLPTNNKFDLRLSITQKGEICLRNGYYSNQIAEIINNRWYNKTRIGFPLAAIVISILALGYTIYTGTSEKSRNKEEMQKLQIQIDTLTNKATRLEKALHPAKIADTTRTRNGE